MRERREIVDVDAKKLMLNPAMEFASRPWENASPADNSYQNKINWWRVMKMLILSDVHGNWPTLRTVLAAESKFGQILCLGDLVKFEP